MPSSPKSAKVGLGFSAVIRARARIRCRDQGADRFVRGQQPEHAGHRGQAAEYTPQASASFDILFVREIDAALPIMLRPGPDRLD